MNQRSPIPAPGFTRISGTRAPPSSWGQRLYCQIRGDDLTAGMVDSTPWPVETTRWIWDRGAHGNIIEHPGDVVAVKKEG